MGQKVNPVGMRIGINKDWNTRWYANNKDFSTYLLEDIKIREFLTKEYADAQLSHVEIERSKPESGAMKIKALVHVVKKGVAVGQEGARINAVKEKLQKLVKTGVVNIEIVTVENPYLDATVVAQMIAKSLEERASFRIAQKRAIKEVRKAGALGIKTEVSGRLGGADIARSEGYKEGILSLHTLRSDIDYAHAEARTTYGRLGVKVWICRGFKEINPKKIVKEGE
jgi:small subunit ribosomal protein S3